MQYITVQLCISAGTTCAHVVHALQYNTVQSTVSMQSNSHNCVLACSPVQIQPTQFQSKGPRMRWRACGISLVMRNTQRTKPTGWRTASQHQLLLQFISSWHSFDKQNLQQSAAADKPHLCRSSRAHTRIRNTHTHTHTHTHTNKHTHIQQRNNATTTITVAPSALSCRPHTPTRPRAASTSQQEDRGKPRSRAAPPILLTYASWCPVYRHTARLSHGSTQGHHVTLSMTRCSAAKWASEPLHTCFINPQQSRVLK